MAILEVRNLVKKFNDFIAVNDISFTVEEARITGLLGPNGAGKTTTIYLLLGLITPTAGSIRIFGKDIGRHRQEILGRMNFSSAYVSLPSNLKVRENLQFFSYLYNVHGWEKRADCLLERFGLRELKNNKTGELSSGQLTRLNLIKALLNNPCFLLLDEPTASLDPLSARTVREQLKEISRQDRVTILYTSHNMREVEEICDEVIFLHHGRITARTTPGDLMRSLRQENMEDVFIELTREGGE
ncbi:MAG: ABC transporter ATP-binding protein [Endomicrobiales bacterium]